MAYVVTFKIIGSLGDCCASSLTAKINKLAYVIDCKLEDEKLLDKKILSVQIDGAQHLAELAKEVAALAEERYTTAQMVDAQHLVELASPVATDAEASTGTAQGVASPRVRFEGSRRRMRVVVKWLQSLPPFVLGGLGLVAGLAVMLLPLIPGFGLAAMIGLGVFSSVLTLILGITSYRNTLQTWRQGKIGHMDTLFSLSTLAILGVSIGSFFVPWLPMMFDAGLMIFGFRQFGLAIREAFQQEVPQSLSFTDRAKKQVLVERGKDNWLLVNREEVKPGEVILIAPGEVIPLNGQCLEDSRYIDVNIEEGAMLPHLKQKNMRLLAGMTLSDGRSMRMLVTNTFAESNLAYIDEFRQKQLALNQHKDEQTVLAEEGYWKQITQKALGYFVLTVIGLAVVSGIVVSIFFPPAMAIQCAIAVLVSACPCTLGMLASLSMMAGLTKSKRHTVLFKNPQSLEKAANIDLLLCDLRGTLTQGNLKIVRSCGFASDVSPEKFFIIAKKLEAHTEHPIGKKIYDYAQNRLRAGDGPNGVVEQLANGVKGNIDGVDYILGNASLLQDFHIALPKVHTDDYESAFYLVRLRDRQTLGYFVISDPLRETWQTTLGGLSKLGIEVKIMTGESEVVAKQYAKAARIPSSQVLAKCAPQTKLDLVKRYTAQGRKVAVLGDGTNDLFALAEAKKQGLSIIIHSPRPCPELADVADVELPDGALLPLLHMFQIAKQTIVNIKQNLIISFGYNIAAILVAGGALLALGVMLHPAAGIAMMVIQAAIIGYNAFRFSRQKQVIEVKTPELPPVPQTFAHAPVSKLQVALQKVSGLRFFNSAQDEIVTPTRSAALTAKGL